MELFSVYFKKLRHLSESDAARGDVHLNVNIVFHNETAHCNNSKERA